MARKIAILAVWVLLLFLCGGCAVGDTTTTVTASQATTMETTYTEMEETTIAPPELTYEAYMAMDAEAQQAFRSGYESLSDFFEWYNAAKAEYEAANPDVVIGEDGNIDLGSGKE